MTMKFIVPLLACSVLAACEPPGRPALVAGRDGETKSSAASEPEDDDGPVPSDPVTIAKAANVKVVQNEGLQCPSQALGPVDVHKKMESTEQALENLKRRAAALGADAVTNVEFEHGEGSKEVTHLSGMAVRCNDLIKGRAYDALGSVRVDGAMGGEERAFKDLLTKGRAIHADLLIDVHFEHGEGGDGAGTKLTATAIKFRPGG